MINWAARWGIPPQAISELMHILAHVNLVPATPAKPGGEAQVSQQVRVVAPSLGGYMWRNNNGALKDERGNRVRYGLANDSKRINTVFKSSDLIGFTMIDGRAIFTAAETKRPGWRAPTNDREHAQAAFLQCVHAGGGIAFFATAPDQYAQAIERWRQVHG